jgi:hypothetical protein
MNWPNVSGAPRYFFAQGTNRGDSSKICIKYATGTSHKIFKSTRITPPS